LAGPDAPSRRRRAILAIAAATGVACLLVGMVRAVCTVRFDNLYRVQVPHLKIREGPGVDSPVIYVLEEGTHVFHSGAEEERNGYTWVRVRFYKRPETSPFRERVEGWVAKEGRDGLPYLERETRRFQQALVARTMFKTRAMRLIEKGIRRLPPSGVLNRAVSFHPDKVLHVLFVALLGCLIFVGFRWLTGWPPLKVMIGSVLVTNLLGLGNEALDLITGKGSFELRDLGANLVGSAAVLLPFVLYLACEKVRRGTENR